MLSRLVTFMNTKQPLEALTHSEREDLSPQSYGTSWTQDYLRHLRRTIDCIFKEWSWTCPIVKQTNYAPAEENWNVVVISRDLEDWVVSVECVGLLEAGNKTQLKIKHLHCWFWVLCISFISCCPRALYFHHLKAYPSAWSHLFAAFEHHERIREESNFCRS